jgi:hypothetical protein
MRSRSICPSCRGLCKTARGLYGPALQLQLVNDMGDRLDRGLLDERSAESVLHRCQMGVSGRYLYGLALGDDRSVDAARPRTSLTPGAICRRRLYSRPQGLAHSADSPRVRRRCLLGMPRVEERWKASKRRGRPAWGWPRSVRSTRAFNCASTRHTGAGVRTRTRRHGEDGNQGAKDQLPHDEDSPSKGLRRRPRRRRSALICV